MSKELSFMLDQICREKGISKDSLITAIESALISAAKKKYSGRANITLSINPKTCAIKAFEIKKVVEVVKNPHEEIALDAEVVQKAGKSVGDTIEIPMPIQDLGRIAAQTAKQIILQKLKEAERNVIYEEFKDKVGKIVSGTVLRKEKGYYYVAIGKVEAVLPVKEIIPKENLKRADVIKAIITEVRNITKSPSVYLSRATPEFVAELFRLEVPEIADGIVKIKSIAREPGERSKIAVYSNDPSVDAVGSCVGMKGTRVQSIVRELKGERIDIIPYSDDPRVFIARSLTPATIDRVGISEDSKTAMVIADDQQLSLAIGKKGQNIKLATKLTGWEIDVISETEYSKIKLEETEKNLADALKSS